MRPLKSEASAAPAAAHGSRRCSSTSPGVREAGVSFAEAHAVVRDSGHATSEARLREVIENGGFEASSSA